MITDGFIKDFKMKMYSEFITSWTSEINDFDRHPILRTYALFKTDYRLENYLLLLPNRSQRISVACFRCSSHQLRIETGRHVKPKLPPEKRTCQYCNTGEIDDEMHFLTVCQFHKPERREIFEHLPNDGNRVNDFIRIMTFKDPDIIARTGRYLHRAFLKRKYSTQSPGNK